MPTSPAPDLPTLLDFETQFEDKAAAILAAAGITAAITKARSTANVPTLDIAIRFDVGEALNHWGITPGGKAHYDMFNGKLEITLFADRDANADSADVNYAQFQLLRGKIAAAFLEGLNPFGGMDWLDVSSFFVRPLGRNAGLGESKLQDLCTMTWAVRFGIIKAAWPSAS
jgi:hypothetical protein